MPAGAFGEEWQVHAAASTTSRNIWWRRPRCGALTWFKWESYATWQSGFAMLCVVYYAGADLFLIDPNVLPMSVPVGISCRWRRSVLAGWSMTCCAGRLWANSDTGLMLVLYCVLVVIAWGLTHLFTGAPLPASGRHHRHDHVGQRVHGHHPHPEDRRRRLIAGRTPHPKYGKIAKQRSLHNNYLTLPVLFLMQSNH